MDNMFLDFIFLLLGGFVVALVVTIGFSLLKHRRLQRIKDPRKDHYRR